MKKPALLIGLLVSTCISFAQHITVTVAGNGTRSFSGDGGPAKAAELNRPNDVCIDAAHNLYFTDHDNGRIRKVAASTGIVTTIAGGGTSTSDGVPATNAFLTPNYLCINTTGDIFVTSENYIKIISGTTGRIFTVAGTSVAGYAGDLGQATAAQLDNPQGICLDAAGNIYVVDRGNNAVRKISATTGIITTIAGGGPTVTGYSGDGGPAISAELNAPGVICANTAGDIYFSDQNPAFPTGYDNSRIRKITTGGIISTIAGSGSGSTIHTVPATAAILGTITGLCCDAAGNLFCNEMSCSCRWMSMVTDTLYHVAGNFYIQGYSDDISSPLANMDHPNGLCVDNTGSVYIADTWNNRLRKVIPLTNNPTFAYGIAQTIDATTSAAYSLTTPLAITDLDSAQVEVFTLVTPPAHGIVTGFMLTAASLGKHQITVPSGGTYTSFPGYVGSDMFRIRVSDGMQADTITIYVNVTGGATTSTNNINVGANTVSVFPNPASSAINVTWDRKATKCRLTITNIADRVVYSCDAASIDNAQIDISTLPAGTYVLTVDGNATKFVKD